MGVPTAIADGEESASFPNAGTCQGSVQRENSIFTSLLTKRFVARPYIEMQTDLVAVQQPLIAFELRG
jgi:hypothetical protein